jgi:RNA polymerase sigma-70 factor (ECF subfamily)
MTPAAAGIVLNTHLDTVTNDLATLKGRATRDVRDESLELFQAHGASLFRFARLMLRTPADAEDVVQTTFVRLLDHLSRGGARSNLKAWLFAVTANLCRDQLRARRRWMGLLPEHDRLLTTPPELEARDQLDLFLAVVRTLAPRDRTLLALKAQGLSYREIAAAAGIREGSVGRLLARALARWQRARAATSHT